MTQNPNELANEDVPEAAHLEVEPYEDSERIEPPDWYDDTINVGEVANAAALDAEEGQS